MDNKQNNKIVQTVPFDFDEIYQGIVQKFAEKGYDAPYEGSNLAQLITIMSYTTSMLNVNTAANINETILTLATKKQNILQDARLLGYEAEHMTSYKYNLTIKSNQDGLLYIPKYTKFEDGDKSYYYVGPDIEINVVTDQILTIQVKEGKYQFYNTNPMLKYVIDDKQYIDIPILDIESDGLDVFLTYYNTEGNLIEKENWTRSQILLLDKKSKLNKEFIRLDDIKLGFPRIYFEIAAIGAGVPRGASVDINVLVSSGTEGEMLNIPKCDIDKFDIINYVLVNKGYNEESNESIKNNAPLLNNTASRAVTASDYEVICNKHSAVESTKAWGGEDEYPIKLGNIYTCSTPSRSIREFTSSEDKTQHNLVDPTLDTNLYLLEGDYRSTTIDVNDKIVNPGMYDILDEHTLPALQFNIRNPVYIDVNFDINIIKYNIGVSKTQRREQIFNIVDNYFNSIEKFDVEFFKSNIIKRIDNEISDITGIELDMNFKYMLTKELLIKENLDNIGDPSIYENDIVIYLNTPYDGIYDDLNEFIITDKLPKIDTLNFKDSENLTVDWSSYIPDINIDSKKKFIKYNIMLGTDVVGQYQIITNRKITIRIKLYIKADDLEGNLISADYNDSTLVVSDFDTPKYIDLKYPTNNFKTGRNTILRLKSCTVI